MAFLLNMYVPSREPLAPCGTSHLLIGSINYSGRILFTVGNVDREISVDIAVDIAVDTRSIVGRHSVDSRSTLGRQSVDIAVDSRSIVGRHSVETRPIVVPDVSRPI